MVHHKLCSYIALTSAENNIVERVFASKKDILRKDKYKPYKVSGNFEGLKII
jgi:hypothetical protein